MSVIKSSYYLLLYVGWQCSAEATGHCPIYGILRAGVLHYIACKQSSRRWGALKLNIANCCRCSRNAFHSLINFILFLSASMEIEVVYYERLEGVLQKVAELVLYANDAPLSQVLREELPEVSCALHWCISVALAAT